MFAIIATPSDQSPFMWPMSLIISDMGGRTMYAVYLISIQHPHLGA